MAVDGLHFVYAHAGSFNNNTFCIFLSIFCVLFYLFIFFGVFCHFQISLHQFIHLDAFHSLDKIFSHAQNRILCDFSASPSFIEKKSLLFYPKSNAEFFTCSRKSKPSGSSMSKSSNCITSN